jgi:hypothetical protein
MSVRLDRLPCEEVPEEAPPHQAPGPPPPGASSRLDRLTCVLEMLRTCVEYRSLS